MAELENKKNRKNRNQNNQTDGIVEKTVCVLRTSKVVKGGRIFGFAGVVVVGDGKGRVGFGRGKAREVPVAIKKATEDARRNMVKVKLVNGTLQHRVDCRHGATKVIMLPAPEGTGIIAGNSLRALFEVMGIENVSAKTIGSRNPINVIRAAMSGLTNMVTPKMVAAKRGKTVDAILHREA